MAITDALSNWSRGQTLSSLSVGSNDSTNTLDFGVARELGSAVTSLLCRFAFRSNATTGTTSTLRIDLLGSNDNSAFTKIATLMEATDSAQLTEGTIFNVDFPMRSLGQAKWRYYKLDLVVGTAVFTGGALDADLLLNAQQTEDYPKNFTNSAAL